MTRDARVRAHVGERGVRAWARGLVGDAGDGRRPDRRRSSARAPGTVSMHQNVTIAEAIVLSCFDFAGQRNRVVYTRVQLPVGALLSPRRERGRGAEVVVVPSTTASACHRAMLGAIDETTLLVPISHVLFQSGVRSRTRRRSCREAREVGAHVVLDVYQSVGTVPLDVADLGVDFAVGGSVKWLCGGPGAGYLYVRPDLVERLEPRLTGWLAHARAVRLRAEIGLRGRRRPLPDRHAERARAVRRHRRLRHRSGRSASSAIREKSMRQTALLVDAARAAGFEVTGAARPRAPRRDRDRAHARIRSRARELAAREILCDYRPDSGHPPRPALLHHRRRASPRGRADRPDRGNRRGAARRLRYLLARRAARSFREGWLGAGRRIGVAHGDRLRVRHPVAPGVLHGHAQRVRPVGSEQRPLR